MPWEGSKRPGIRGLESAIWAQAPPSNGAAFRAWPRGLPLPRDEIDGAEVILIGGAGHPPCLRRARITRRRHPEATATRCGKARAAELEGRQH